MLNRYRNVKTEDLLYLVGHEQKHICDMGYHMVLFPFLPWARLAPGELSWSPLEGVVVRTTKGGSVALLYHDAVGELIGGPISLLSAVGSPFPFEGDGSV